MIRWTDKDPSDNDVVYSLDFSDVIATGDKLDTTEWEAHGDLTIVGLDPIGNLAQVQISGGVAGETYTVVCRAKLESGQRFQRNVKLMVREQ